MPPICGFSTTHEQEMTKQIAINLCQGVSCTLHANPGVMSPSNVITPKNRLRFAQTAFIVIENEKDNQNIGNVRTSYKP